MQLNLYHNQVYRATIPFAKLIMWYLLGCTIVRSRMMPFSGLKVWILRMFRAKIGKGVQIRPGVRVKFPWKLSIGDHSWIGEDVWIDNLAEVKIGSNCCLSQGVYLCTGSHDWRKESFDLIVKPIHIGDHVWLGAQSRVAPGVTVGEGAVLTLGSVATKELVPWSIYQGNPAILIKKREITRS